jgi:stage II sporulation protein D
MRRFALYLLSGFLLVLVGVPLVSLRLYEGQITAPVGDPSDEWPVTVYFPQSKTIETIPLGEYLTGVVAAEVPETFVQEAVKAQFVAARTYTLRRMARFRPQGKGGCPLNPAADLCADSQTSQAYKSKDELIKQEGALAAEAWWARLDAARKETAGIVLRYQGELIEPLYHSVSGRLTEDVADVFGTDLPYLKPVDDHWGQGAPSQLLQDEVHFTLDQLASKLDEAVPATASGAGGYRCTTEGKVEPLSGTSSPVRILSCTGSGRVKSVQVAGQTMAASTFRKELGLRSTDFELQFKNGALYIETHGWGHGLGMSQWGANGMAEAGKGFAEILTHYYPGAKLERIH